MSYIVTTQEDPENPGEMILPIPDALLEELGWKEGDDLIFEMSTDGKLSLRKKDEE